MSVSRLVDNVRKRRITRDAQRRLRSDLFWRCQRDVIQTPRSTYFHNDMFIIYLIMYYGIWRKWKAFFLAFFCFRRWVYFALGFAWRCLVITGRHFEKLSARLDSNNLQRFLTFSIEIITISCVRTLHNIVHTVALYPYELFIASILCLGHRFNVVKTSWVFAELSLKYATFIDCFNFIGAVRNIWQYVVCFRVPTFLYLVCRVL